MKRKPSIPTETGDTTVTTVKAQYHVSVTKGEMHQICLDLDSEEDNKKFMATLRHRITDITGYLQLQGKPAVTDLYIKLESYTSGNGYARWRLKISDQANFKNRLATAEGAHPLDALASVISQLEQEAFDDAGS
ncbi:hypothetical protein PMIN01_07213 [Paraphaeosphaeria minitans]|uniref:Uncharacterized protein n=1 Tax=Paraphaeosphaeria minitans TaxID=565426 RepID=A0A9P6GFZ7_9PLEO|nr:hypothetical protein PMIN01_07213 [Paraphaeosphaeria minitans]